MRTNFAAKKKFILDMFLNILANALPTFTLQLLILPTLANYMTGTEYGLLLTLISLLNVIPSTFGNSLNNIRLIHGTDISISKENVADYNLLLTILTIFNVLFITFFSFLYNPNISKIGLFLVIVISIVWIFREYFIVSFRIKINYSSIVLTHIILTIGFGIGFLLFRISGYWQLIYIFGNILSLAYIFQRSDLWKEKIAASKRFKKLSLETFLLITSNMLSRVTIYADKLLIFPVLGGTMVSVYYAATIFGKVVSLAITPISSVMLSYLSKENKANSSHKQLLLISSILCLVGFFVTLLISRPVLTFIYPQFVDEAMKYILWTTATVSVTALTSVVNPFILKFFDMKWQIIINGGAAVIYIALSMSLLMNYGLTGFCIGAFLTSVFKLVLMVGLLNYNEKKEAYK